MMLKTEYDGLIKWIIVQKGEKINRHVIYTEEKFPCACDPLENKANFVRNQHVLFEKLVSAVFADVMKRWMKLGNVEIFYKGLYSST